MKRLSIFILILSLNHFIAAQDQITDEFDQMEGSSFRGSFESEETDKIPTTIKTTKSISSTDKTESTTTIEETTTTIKPIITEQPCGWFKWATFRCPENQCSCQYGKAASGSNCLKNLSEQCDSCDDGYYLSENKCLLKQCTCVNGQGAIGISCLYTGSEKCSSCNSGYKLLSNKCFDAADNCKCLKGEKAFGKSNCDVNLNSQYFPLAPYCTVSYVLRKEFGFEFDYKQQIGLANGIGLTISSFIEIFLKIIRTEAGHLGQHFSYNNAVMTKIERRYGHLGARVALEYLARLISNNKQTFKDVWETILKSGLLDKDTTGQICLRLRLELKEFAGKNVENVIIKQNILSIIDEIGRQVKIWLKQHKIFKKTIIDIIRKPKNRKFIQRQLSLIKNLLLKIQKWDSDFLI